MKTTVRSRVRRPLRQTAVAAAALAVLFTGAACGADSDTEAGANSAETRAVETEQGTITVPADPQRVVVLNASLAGYLFDLDVPIVAADTRMIGVNTDGDEFPPSLENSATEQGTEVLPAASEIPVEVVASYDPDLIIGGGQGFTGVLSVDAYDQLAEIAPTVLVPNSAADWQDQLEFVASAVGRSDQVDIIMESYRDRISEVAAAITPPEGQVAYILTTSDPSTVTMISATAALPEMMNEIGFEADADVWDKAGNPELYGTGDSFQFSLERLEQAVDAPVVFVIALDGGRTAEELAADPVYARLPAFQNGNVYDLPATSFRPDFRLAMDTLDIVEAQFG